MKLLIFFILAAAGAFFWYRTRLTEVGRVITKGILIYLFGAGCLLSVGVLVISIFGVAEAAVENSIEERMEHIEHYYYAGDYDKMREVLLLYQCFEEEFRPYWEIAEAEQAYHEYLIYEKIAVQNEQRREEYEQKKDESREKLLSIQENSEFEQNKSLLAYYADFVQ